MPQFMMQSQYAPPPPQPIAPQQEADESDNNDSSTDSQDAKITTSASMMKGLPRVWLSTVVEKVEPMLDSTYTSELSRVGLLALIWIWCRVKPGVKISELRALPMIVALVLLHAATISSFVDS